MLHEGLGSVTQWRDFPERLAAQTGRRIVAYSRAGYGASEPPRGARTTAYMHDEARDALPAVLDALAIEHPVLFGHSDGASIALLYASMYPERPRALVLEAPHVFVEELSVRSIAEMRTLYATTDLRAKLARHHADVDTVFFGWNDIWLDPAFRSWNIEAALAAIRCPVLLIQGEDDEYGTPAQLASIAARVSTTETLLLANCGHAPHRDQPAAVLAATAAFLATTE
jgi:pimeloyl-ACP methyl ester carboxylesterase